MNYFSGSYLEEDVMFLLKKIEIKELDIVEKEALIQSGKKHYSEMISPEYQPTKEYIDIFYNALSLNEEKFIRDVFYLAKKISLKKDFVIVSLARAGTPIGVLLKRILKKYFNLDINHYSVSIIRDRGIDKNAIKYIVENNKNSELVFIDGWTGKGVISQELENSIKEFNIENKTNISSNLYVVTDISGKAYFSSSFDDYLIPSSVLNSTVSGLVSRTIFNTDYCNKNDFHACKYYDNLKESDFSLFFIDTILNSIEKNYKILEKIELNEIDNSIKKELSIKTDKFISELMNEYKITNKNYIKPGIGETTRVLLRRSPELIFLKNLSSSENKHLLFLSKNRSITIIENQNMPYNSLGIISRVSKE